MTEPLTHITAQESHRPRFRAGVLSAPELQQALQDEPCALIERAFSGDRAALSALTTHLTPVVQATVARCVWRRSGRAEASLASEMQDVIQEVLLRLFGSSNSPLLRWRPERGLSLTGFVRLVAQHHVADILRSGKFRCKQTEVVDTAALEQQVDDQPAAERTLAVRQEVASLITWMRQHLSERGFEMFCRLWIDAETIPQIRLATGQTPAAIYQWRRRISQVLEGSARSVLC